MENEDTPLPVCQRAKRRGSVVCGLSASEAMRVWSEAEPSEWVTSDFNQNTTILDSCGVGADSSFEEKKI